MHVAQEVAAVIHACLRFKPEQRPSAKEVVELLELCGHERPAGAAPAEQFQAQPSASYRATIEDSARRLHSADADRRRSWDCRASIDVRRVRLCQGQKTRRTEDVAAGCAGRR